MMKLYVKPLPTMILQKKMIPLPSRIAKHGVKTKKVNGEITMCCGEQAFRANIYTFDPYEHRSWRECIKSMYEDGVRVFSYLCPMVLCWDIENEYDFSLLDELHDSILEIAPEALLIPRVFLTTPSWWDDKYPDELLRFKNHPPEIKRWGNEDQKLWKYEAKMYHDTRNASIASPQWKRDAGNALEAFIKHSMNKYPGYFMAFHLAYGTCGEWGTFGSYKNGRFGSFDFSAPMIKAFREFLKNKYTDESALRAAWRSSEVSFASAMPPGKLELLQTDYFTLKNPCLHQRCSDWFEHYSSTLYSAVGHFCSIVKKASPRPALTLLFGGGILNTGASVYQLHFSYKSFDKLLSQPDLDIVATPNWYVNRKTGIASQAPVASISAKKLFIAECDVRTLADTENGFTPAAPANAEEGFRNFCRDSFFNISQGQGLLWWYDFGCGWFLSPEIRKVIKKLNLLQANLPHPKCGQAETAVVVDQKSNSFTEGSCGYFRQFQNLLNHLLPYSGIPFDVITLDDMFERPAYKLYIFRDLFYCPGEIREKLRCFVKKHKASCVWFYAAGTIDEHGIKTGDSHSLTRIKLKTHKMTTSSAVTLLNGGHPLCAGLPLPLSFSETNDLNTITSPVFSADDPHADNLGQLESLELPGIACKHKDDRFDLWSASPLLDSAFCANIALAAGCRQQAPPGVMTFGSGAMRMFLSKEKIKAKIYWDKSTTTLWNVISGKVYYRGGSSFDVPLASGNPILLVEQNRY